MALFTSLTELLIALAIPLKAFIELLTPFTELLIVWRIALPVTLVLFIELFAVFVELLIKSSLLDIDLSSLSISASLLYTLTTVFVLFEVSLALTKLFAFDVLPDDTLLNVVLLVVPRLFIALTIKLSPMIIEAWIEFIELLIEFIELFIDFK